MYTTLSKTLIIKLENIFNLGKKLFFYDDIQLVALGKKYGIKNFSSIFRHYCENKSGNYTKQIKNNFNILKRDLSQLELYSIGSGFSKKSLSNLQYAYRKYSRYMNKKKIPYFYIAIPVADRENELNNLLTSISDELELFGYPADHVIVNIFNDGKNNITLKNNNNLCINVRNIDDQVKFLYKRYKKESIKKIEGIYINNLDNKKCLNGSAVTMNMARLILNKYISKANSLIWFIDSDQDFSILTKKSNAFYKIPHAFSIFHDYYTVFHKKNVIFATGSVVGDPAFSAPLMLRTQLMDLKNAQEKNKIDLNNFKYFHDNFAYYDLNIFTDKADNKEGAFPYLPYISNNKKSFHPFFDILFGHHITRPMLYSLTSKCIMKNGLIKKDIGTTNIVWPGNFIFRKEGLKFPTMFACEKVRIHGPIFGFILNSLGQKIYRVNCPCFHDRMFNKNSLIQGYRGGTQIKCNYVDLSDLRMKQIEGDIILEYLKKIKFMNNDILGKFFDNTFSECYKNVVDAHDNNIKKIVGILKYIKKNKSNEILIESINKTISGLNLNIDKESIKEEIIQLTTKLSNIKYDLDLWFNIINS